MTPNQQIIVDPEREAQQDEQGPNLGNSDQRIQPPEPTRKLTNREKAILKKQQEKLERQRLREEKKRAKQERDLKRKLEKEAKLKKKAEEKRARDEAKKKAREIKRAAQAEKRTKKSTRKPSKRGSIADNDSIFGARSEISGFEDQNFEITSQISRNSTVIADTSLLNQSVQPPSRVKTNKTNRKNQAKKKNKINNKRKKIIEDKVEEADILDPFHDMETMPDARYNKNLFPNYDYLLERKLDFRTDIQHCKDENIRLIFDIRPEQLNRAFLVAFHEKNNYMVAFHHFGDFAIILDSDLIYKSKFERNQGNK